MKWVKDRTGRFTKRPHYLPAELDEECEQLVTTFLKSRHSPVTYPIATDDLTVLMESLTDSLDLYADLSGEEGEVEGVTDFIPHQRPKVRISKKLTEDMRMTNRLRTTLTHELGHVHFHSSLFNGERSGDLFSVEPEPRSNKCTRAVILQTVQTDWIEWQAGYACGAFLMPATALAATIRDFLNLYELKCSEVWFEFRGGPSAHSDSVHRLWSLTRRGTGTFATTRQPRWFRFRSWTRLRRFAFFWALIYANQQIG
jgi:hypothetical protein